MALNEAAAEQRAEVLKAEKERRRIAAEIAAEKRRIAAEERGKAAAEARERAAEARRRAAKDEAEDVPNRDNRSK